MENPIVEKIRKLMALSHSSNEHEAALAMARCQDLLAQHNMTMAEVENSTRSTGNVALDAKRGKAAHNSAAMYKYQRSLMEALSRNNFCSHFIDENQWKVDSRGKKSRYNSETGIYEKGRHVKVHVLIGREDNVTVTRLMYDYLMETMDRLLPYQGMDKRGKEALLWLEGCTETLVNRLNVQREEKERETRKRREEAAARGETGLILMSDVYNTESELNSDVRWGRPLGTTTRYRMEREARWRAESQKEEDLIAGGMPAHDAWYVARGMEIPNQIKVEGKVQTEAKRVKREKVEARDNERHWARFDREQQERHERTSSLAYQQGRTKGHDIGLNQQVSETSTRRIG